MSNAYTDGLVGFRVRVLYGPAQGHVGTVKACYDSKNSIAVQLDDATNFKSKYGYFYFRRTDLELVGENDEDTITTDKGGETMQTISNYVNIAVIRFLNDDVPFRNFEYANFDPTLKAGDLCVVKSAHHGLGLAEVEEIRAETGKELNREVVTKIDDSAYRYRVEQREQAALLKEKMQQRAKQLQDIVLYQTLAKDDPEMFELLKSYQALNL